ncbi:MAG: STAS domain-containing protein [Candidatus Tectimicrobiota bacterium]
MDIAVDRQDDRVIVTPMGNIDTPVAEAFQQRLLAVIQDHTVPVELDFAAVPYISSAGLRVLALAARALRQRHQVLRLTQPTPLVLSVLNLTNFTSFIEVSA